MPAGAVCYHAGSEPQEIGSPVMVAKHGTLIFHWDDQGGFALIDGGRCTGVGVLPGVLPGSGV